MFYSVFQSEQPMIYTATNILLDKWYIYTKQGINEFQNIESSDVNNYIVRSYRDVIVVTNTAAKRTNKT